MTWTVERYERDDGESPVEDFIRSLPTKVRARVWAAITQLEEVGNLAKVPLSKPLGQGVFELRVDAGRHEVRILYAFFPERKIVLLHGILKKTRAVPSQDLDTARARLRELQEG